ncbi:MAG TPA: NADPH:quinone oxidoreductase family protein [Burkholderiales bacterium]|nr:NADPH:quinone oxidoreductase family protein [Burkholderiales bacterium]
MRAALYDQFGPIENMRIADLPSPRAGKGQVVVRVKAAGVSFPDVLTIQKKYQVIPDLPFSPGGEVSGVVTEVGEDVTQFRVGDAVFGGARNACREEVVAEAARLWPMPPGLDPLVAAGFGMNYATSWYALKYRGELKAGETLLVLGASGGVGLAAVDIGKRLGARVIACASTAEKLAACKTAGADELINYTTEDLREAVKRLTGGRGIDVCYDPVGDKYAEPMVRSMAWGGRYLVIGFAAGDIPKIALNLPLLKGSAIVGVFLGGLMNADPLRGREIYAELIGEVAAGRLKPLISASYPLERTVEALQAMATRKVLGKVVVTP